MIWISDNTWFSVGYRFLRNKCLHKYFEWFTYAYKA